MSVPIQTPPPPSYAEQAIERMEAERKLLQDEKFTGWGVIWTLFAFKMATVIVIIIVGANASDRSTGAARDYILSTTWYWFLIPLISVSGYITYKLRLRKVRKRVSQLRQAEFLESPDENGSDLTVEEKQRLRRLRHLPEDQR